mmetsp:Transcript_2822/g.3748  ORF Transcript_2822/g.3748 Transcript_2822/m.3748 type:complete len:279 (+) Transcript_2822:2-838(+)
MASMKKKKSKQPKDSKRNKSSFMLFCKSSRSDLEKQFPHLDKIAIKKKLCKIWLQLPAEERKPFLDQAKEDLDRFKKEQDDNFGSPTKRNVNTKPPKRKKPAFMLFCEERRDEVKQANPHFSVHQVTKKLSSMWLNLTKEQRDAYDVVAEMDFWRSQLEQEEQELKSEEMEVTPQHQYYVPPPEPNMEYDMSSFPSLEPTKEEESGPPRTAYQYFFHTKIGEVKNQHPYLRSRDVQKVIHEMWNKLPADSKEMYNALAEYDLKQFIKAKKQKMGYDSE